MAKLELKQQFRGPCIVCNCMPVDEDSEVRRPHPMFVAFGRDVNWGEDLNICVICAGVMADMLGRSDELTVRRTRKQLEETKAELKKVTETFDKYRDKAKRIIDGKKAQKELREEA